jgi:hypothetical protein
VSTGDRQRAESLNSLAKVCQRSTNSLPYAAKPQVNAIFTNSPEKPVPNADSSTRDDFRDRSETPPRPLRDQWQTIGRLDPQN